MKRTANPLHDCIISSLAAGLGSETGGLTAGPEKHTPHQLTRVNGKGSGKISKKARFPSGSGTAPPHGTPLGTHLNPYCIRAIHSVCHRAAPRLLALNWARSDLGRASLLQPPFEFPA